MENSLVSSSCSFSVSGVHTYYNSTHFMTSSCKGQRHPLSFSVVENIVLSEIGSGDSIIRLQVFQNVCKIIHTCQTQEMRQWYPVSTSTSIYFTWTYLEFILTRVCPKDNNLAMVKNQRQKTKEHVLKSLSFSTAQGRPPKVSN